MSCSEFVFDMCLFCVVRNKDLTWPEEMCQLAKNRASIIRSKQSELYISLSQTSSIAHSSWFRLLVVVLDCP